MATNKPVKLIRELTLKECSMLPFQDMSTQIDRIRAEKSYPIKYSIASSNIFIGVEVEVEQIFKQSGIIKLDEDHFLWRNIEDGSLRNHGREFVSVPLSGHNIAFAMEALQQTLTKDKNCIGYEFTDRTSVHVHMDVQPCTIETICNIVLLYIMVEPFLYNFCGGDRHNNIFCVPLNMSPLTYLLKKLFDCVETNEISGLRNLSNWPKYTGFNLKPVGRYGTIEFRHMIGNIDVPKLMMWINLIMKLRLFSEGQNYDKLKHRILEMNTTSEYRNFCREIFGDLYEEIRGNNIETHMENMVIYIKDIYATNVGEYPPYIKPELIKEIDEVFLKSSFFKRGLALGLYKKLSKQEEKDKAKRYSGFNFEPLNWTAEPDAVQRLVVADEEPEQPTLDEIATIDLLIRDELTSWLTEENNNRQAQGRPRLARHMIPLEVRNHFNNRIRRNVHLQNIRNVRGDVAPQTTDPDALVVHIGREGIEGMWETPNARTVTARTPPAPRAHPRPARPTNRNRNRIRG